jgi:putative flavoprotein involved in K+ transport
MDQRADALPDPQARLFANVLGTGHDGGHDLNLRTLRDLGVTLVGRFMGATQGVARFAQDLGDTVAWGDDRYRQLRQQIETYAATAGLSAPPLPDPDPFDDRSPDRVDLEGFGAVILAGGFRPDYRSWLPWPEALDDLGFPIQRDGASTVVPGLSFVGVHFLRTRKSSLLMGVGEDAAIVAEAIAREG